MSHRLKALAALEEDLVWFPVPIWLLITIPTSSPKECDIFFGLCRYQACMWFTEVGKTLIDIVFFKY